MSVCVFFFKDGNLVQWKTQLGLCATDTSANTCLQTPQGPSKLHFPCCWSCESGYHMLYQSHISSAQSRLPRGGDYTTKIKVPLQVCNTESKIHVQRIKKEGTFLEQDEKFVARK